MSDHGAGVAYRLWCEDTRDWTPTEGRIKANNAIAELEHELAGVAKTLAIALGEKLDQEYRAIAAEAERAERDRMLRLAFEQHELPASWQEDKYADWLADLRARAEEGSET